MKGTKKRPLHDRGRCSEDSSAIFGSLAALPAQLEPLKIQALKIYLQL
jgi:hypothetical protein